MGADGNDWLVYAWDFFKVTFAASGSVASAVFLWFARNYHTHLALLRRCNERLDDAERELGDLKAAKQTMTTALSVAVAGSKRRDKTLHKRIDETNEAQHETATELAEIKNDIKWICKHLKQQAGDDEKGS